MNWQGWLLHVPGVVLLDDTTLTTVVPADDTLGNLTTRIGIRGTGEWILVAVLASTRITTGRLYGD